MRAANADILLALGVNADLVTPFLTRLAVQSLSRSCGILNLFHGSRSARDDTRHVITSNEGAGDEGDGDGVNAGADIGHGHAHPAVGAQVHTELGVAVPHSDALLAMSIAGRGVGTGQDLVRPLVGVAEPCAHVGSRALLGVGAQCTADPPS